jgi:hypothetical protein
MVVSDPSIRNIVCYDAQSKMLPIAEVHARILQAIVD